MPIESICIEREYTILLSTYYIIMVAIDQISHGHYFIKKMLNTAAAAAAAAAAVCP